MKTVQLTQEQSDAIHVRGRPLLVSAAAGSGKTFVLVRRLMEQICSPDAPADITDYLVITYTRAAASELKTKIQEALYREIAVTSVREPGRLRHLKRQTLLMPRAHINTIHGFCSAIVREYTDVLGVRTDSRIIESTEDTELKERVLDRILEEYYAVAGTDAGFLELTRLLTDSTSDRRLKKTVLDIYDSLQSVPYPDLWISGQLKMLSAAVSAGFSDTLWGKSLLLDGRSKASWCAQTLHRICRMLSADEKPPEKWISGLQAAAAQIEAFVSSCDSGWEEAQAVTVQFPNAVRGAGEKYPYAKAMVDTVKSVIGQTTGIVSQTSADIARDMAMSAPAIRCLYRLITDFDSSYTEEKLSSGRMTYSDLEHLTLRLFRSPEGSGFSEAALAVSRRFREVLVDEYQDINPVQEMIVQAVSSGGERLFCVGDMKQSIYRFRESDVSIFKNKYDAFPDYDGREGTSPVRILLSRNFRSCRGIVDGINHVFASVMSEELGDISYGESERLQLGRRSPDTQEPCCEILLPDGVDECSADEYRRKEAFCVASEIRRMVSCGEMIRDGSLSDQNGDEGLRPLTYDDFAVLFRSMSQSEKYYKEAFDRFGIPYNSVRQDPWFVSDEVALLLDYLSVINNPHQDIPLMHVLTSPLYRFSFDMMTDIRTAAPSEDLYNAVRYFSEGSQECRAFLEHLEGFRRASRYMQTDRLLRMVLKKTEASILLGQSEDSVRSEENIARLLRFTESFESHSFQGLYHFDLRIRYLRESGKIPDSQDAAGSGGVSLMTIHRSKGLEYPVVFIGDTFRKFNQSDEREPVLFHRELGAGLYVMDGQRKIRYPSAARIAIRQRLNREMVSEEMRILYVALTRAKDRLIIPVYTKASQKLIENAGILGRTMLETPLLAGGKSLQDWLLSVILQDPRILHVLTDPESARYEGYPWMIRRVPVTDGPEDGGVWQHDGGDAHEARNGEKDLQAVLSYRYPYESDFGIPTKITATELKGTVLTAECLEEASPSGYPRPRIRRPDLEEGGRALDSREKGTAMHCAMQYLDYDRCFMQEDLEAEIQRLVEARFLSITQAVTLDRDAILKLFSGPLGKKLLEAPHIRREFKFSLLAPAHVLLGGDSQEQVLFQGAVDCWWEDEDGITVVDFKTDRITDANRDLVTDRYRKQVELYAYALERITGVPVRHASLYYFSIGEEVTIIEK